MKTFNLPIHKPATNRELAELQSGVGGGVDLMDIAIAPQARDIGNLSVIDMLYQRLWGQPPCPEPVGYIEFQRPLVRLRGRIWRA